MRRVVQEELIRFDGTPLSRQRRAYTRTHVLSPAAEELDAEVTEHVRGEFQRVDALEDEPRAGTVSFALMTLQRRLASSPEAIYRSLRRRRQRLEAQAFELEQLAGKGRVDQGRFVQSLDGEELDDLEEGAEDEVQNMVLDQATAASSLAKAGSRDRHFASPGRPGGRTAAKGRGSEVGGTEASVGGAPRS